MKSVQVKKSGYDSENKIWEGPVLRPYYDRNCSFGSIAFEELRRRGNHLNIISDPDDIQFTCNEVRLQAIRIARSFEKFGIKQTDIIGICVKNNAYILALASACFFHGSAYHATNPIFDKKTTKHLFNTTKPKLVFCDEHDVEKIQDACSDFETRIFTMKNNCKGFPSLMDLLQPTGDEDEYVPAKLERGRDQNLVILCSSGSTGTPKAVTISNYAIIKFIFQIDFLTLDDTQYMITTMDWISALGHIIQNLVFGVPVVVSDKPFTPDYFSEIAEKYKISVCFLSPTLIAGIVKCPKVNPDKLKSIKYIMFGGATTPLNILNDMRNMLPNARMVQGYAFTEFNAAFCIGRISTEKGNSVGPLCAGLKARIINGNGDNLGPNEVGEILCYHGLNWSGYYGNEEETKEIYDKDGWFHSGDNGYFDDDGFLYIADRKKNLLKYDTMHYYPNDIEKVISEIPDVKEVCVFGVFSELHGDMAAAAVCKVEGSQLTSNDVINYVRENTEAIYRHLHGGCKIFESLPKTGNTKIDRRTIKNLYLKE